MAKCHLINGPTFTEGVLRAVETWNSYEDLPPAAKGTDGQYLIQAAFRWDLLDDINERARYRLFSEEVTHCDSVWITGR